MRTLVVCFGVFGLVMGLTACYDHSQPKPASVYVGGGGNVPLSHVK